MPASIRFNPDRTLCEVVVDGVTFGPAQLESADETQVVCRDPDDGSLYIAILKDFEGLQANTVYQLVELETTTRYDVEMDGDDTDDGDGDDGDDGGEAAS